MNKILTGIICFALSASLSSAQAETRKEKKGIKLEQESQQLETKTQQQEAEGHPLRAGRDAKKSARKGARAERKLKNDGETPVPTTSPQ